jgi:hypothetical protein
MVEWRYISMHSEPRHSMDNCSASRTDCFVPGDTTPGTHWTGKWVGLRTVLDVVEKIYKSYLSQESNLDASVVVQSVA